MNEITHTPQNRPEPGVQGTIHARMDRIRTTMHAIEGLLPYLINAGQHLTAEEETGRYFDLLEQWNALYEESQLRGSEFGDLDAV